MKDKIEAILKAKDAVIEEFEVWCKDKTIPLDERWELFIKSELGKFDGCYHNPDGINWNKKTLFDDFYMNKNAVIDAESFVEIAEAQKHAENIEEVKEYFLQNFLGSFEHDW